MKRHLVYPFDFDGRAHFLQIEVKDEWEDAVKQSWVDNKERVKIGLRLELGDRNFETKVRNFTDCGAAPFSIVSYHNEFYHQIRYSFCHGYYYPSLVAASALGERILNHLILDLRDEFTHTAEYKDIYKKKSFDKWSVPIAALQAWGVFQHDEVGKLFQTLGEIRNRSIHFNTSTYRNLRADALEAIQALSKIIRLQFGFFAEQKWAIPGTQGHAFISKEAESDAFIRRYYLPQCPLVGPYFSIKFEGNDILFFDFESYDEPSTTDELFAERFNNRDVSKIAPSDSPVLSGIVCQRINYTRTKP